MYIQIDQQNYFIQPTDKMESIQVLYQKENTIHLLVPAHLAQEQLVVYIRSHQKYITSQLLLKQKANSLTIDIFDRLYTLVLDTSVRTPYLEINHVRVPVTFKSSKQQINSLKEQLLIQQANQQFAAWEERLGMLLPQIKLRKLQKNNFFKTHNTNHITLSKELMDKPIDIFCYIMAEIVFNHTKLDLKYREQLLDKHVMNWRHLQKILSYERINNI